MDALVTDAHVRSAVAGIRELGRAGLGVLAVASGRGAAGLWSRHTAARALAPDSTAQPMRFAEAIGQLAERHGPLVVYPGHEDAIEALVSSVSVLPRSAMLPFPAGEPVAVLRDKRRIGELAARGGLRAPETFAVERAGAIEPAELPLPCVVKPAQSSLGIPSAGIAHDRGALAALLGEFPRDEVVVVQELLEGPIVALAVVIDRNGRLAARFQQRALATWPRDGGLISLAVSETPDEALSQRVAGMLAELGYHGLVQFDLILTRRGPALIDANPRFYASQPLAMAAGLNLSAAWHAVVAGTPPRGPAPYRVGVRFRWLEADLKDAMMGKPRALLRRGPSRAVGAMWDRHDPVPGPLLAASAAAAAARNAAAAAARKQIRG